MSLLLFTAMMLHGYKSSKYKINCFMYETVFRFLEPNRQQGWKEKWVRGEKKFDVTEDRDINELLSAFH